MSDEQKSSLRSHCLSMALDFHRHHPSSETTPDTVIATAASFFAHISGETKPTDGAPVYAPNTSMAA